MLVHRVTAAEALRHVVEALQGAQPLPDLLGEILLQVRAFLAADEAYILRRIDRALVPAATAGLPPGAMAARLPIDAGLEAAALQIGDTVASPRASMHPRFVDPFKRAHPVGAFAATPMRVRGITTGVLVATRTARGQFGEAALWWLELFSSLAAFAIAQDDIDQSRETRARQSEFLLALSDIDPDDPVEFLPILIGAAAEHLGLDGAFGYLLDADRGALVRVAPPVVPGQGDIALPDRVARDSPHAIAGAFASGQDAIVTDVREDRALEPLFGRLGSRTIALISIRVLGDPRGIIGLSARRPNALGQSDRPFLRLVGDRVGLLLEREEVRQRRSDARAREEFVGIVSHELKTPVAVVQAYIEVLERRAERENRARDTEVLRSMSGQMQRMLAMIEELLDIQRIEAGLLRLERSRFDLAEAVKQTAESLAITATRHQITVGPGKSIVVEADRRRIDEIIVNLVENAVRYSPDGGPIEVAVRGGAGTARVTVRDRGVGIAPEDQARVFERFFRASGVGDRLREGHHGLGLGLYISREIVRQHGGTMGVESAPGQGSTFWFEIPAGEARP
jgi:signal transduction histidine kinase